jgi:hypothetical protein
VDKNGGWESCSRMSFGRICHTCRAKLMEKITKSRMRFKQLNSIQKDIAVTCSNKYEHSEQRMEAF